MKYKCLILDHDDTVVDSTKSIHYPVFKKYLTTHRPDEMMSLKKFFLFNFDPGFSEYLKNDLCFTDEEYFEQNQLWEEYVLKHVPKVYEGIKDILETFKKNGGYICVVSHSLKKNILRDYEKNSLPIPDLVFGWELNEDQRKPSPYPLVKIKELLNVEYSEMVVVDDLKPGKIMADKCNVDFIAAGWAHSIKEIVKYMKEENKIYCKTVDELKSILFND